MQCLRSLCRNEGFPSIFLPSLNSFPHLPSLRSASLPYFPYKGPTGPFPKIQLYRDPGSALSVNAKRFMVHFELKVMPLVTENQQSTT